MSRRDRVGWLLVAVSLLLLGWLHRSRRPCPAVVGAGCPVGDRLAERGDQGAFADVGAGWLHPTRTGHDLCPGGRRRHRRGAVGVAADGTAFPRPAEQDSVVARVSEGGEPLPIAARLVNSELAVVRQVQVVRALLELSDLPAAGCWCFDLSWSGRPDSALCPVPSGLAPASPTKPVTQHPDNPSCPWSDGFTTVGACGRRAARRPVQERLQDVGVALVADRQAPVASSQARDRSTFQRWRPSRALDSTPWRAIRGLDAPAAQRPPAGRVVVALVGVQLGRSLARPAGPPRGPMTAGTASTSVLQELGVVGVGGRQPARPAGCRGVDQQVVLGAGLPRSAGFAPVEFPPRRARTLTCRSPPGTSRPGRRRPASPAADGARPPRRRRLASRAAAASRSRRCHSPAPWPAAAARAPRPAARR